jgi:hypothetical protein
MLESALSAVGSALILMPTVTELGKQAANSACEATVYSCALSLLNLASVGSETVAASCMRSLSVTKGNVNNVRVFVGVVAVITLFAAPAALLFPKSKKSSVIVVRLDEDDEDQTSRLIGGTRREKPRGPEAFELSMGSDSADSAELAEATTDAGGSTGDAASDASDASDANTDEGDAAV